MIRSLLQQALIKSYFSRNCHTQYRGDRSTSRLQKKEQAIWQRRFWEHCIDREADLTTHLNYIHYNPVRHRLVTCVHQWQYSSFHREVKRGNYRADWGCNCLLESDRSPERTRNSELL